MSSYELHEPDFSGTTTEHWDEPSRDGFETDDLDEIADHYLLSESGFPPESFDDLALPVVEVDGDLNYHGLDDAQTGADSVEVLDASDEVESEVKHLVQSLKEEHFPEEAEGGAIPQAIEAKHDAPPEELHHHEAEYHLHHEDEVREREAKEVLDREERPEKGQ